MFVHGFCGSGALFYRLWEYLIDHLTMVFVDLPGMGGSEHPNDYDKDSESLEGQIEYFVEYLERWRQSFTTNIKNILGLEFDKFHLGGHSFGGYIVGNYAIKYT